MKTVRNLTKLPIKIPLPRNKVLRLAPGRTGQIKDDAAEQAVFKTMEEEGKIEIVVGGARASGTAGGASGPTLRAARAGGAAGHRKTGDR